MTLTLNFQNAGLFSSKKANLAELKVASKLNYDTDMAALNLPIDKKMLTTVEKIVTKKKKLNPEMIIVCGIGGSNLGTIAIAEALLGKQHNIHEKPKVYYADTVDNYSISFINKEMKRVLTNSQKSSISGTRKNKKVILVGISKSGGTTETIANFSILLRTLKKYDKEYKKSVVVISDTHSKFWEYGKKNSFVVLDIPKKVGGRYSVFSPVGLFPLGMLGINIRALLKGAEKMRSACLKRSSPALKGANAIFSNFKRGKTIYDTFLFSNNLESTGKWYRQLMGESVGKERDLNNKKVFRGITPTVSIGSTDLHSMAQLYLGGPHDKYTSIITIKEKKSLSVPAGYDSLVPNLEKKQLHELMTAIEKGVKIAFKKGNRPFNEIIFNKVDEETLGAFFQLKMIEMIHLGKLLNVNPFDQPNVEMYKIETKKILKKPVR